MAKLMTSNSLLKEGVFLNKWFESRIRSNKNVLLAISGSTGSGKTYSCLDGGESWYHYYFKEEFPIENVCFGLSILVKRINDLHKAGKLRKGDLFILEEAGANFGNLDFQNKLSKMFNYILQSFRSMNLIVIMNLPVLTMLNKAARQLIHGHFITCGIDYANKKTKVKPYFHQLNQGTGKSYWKYPRIRINGKIITLQRLKFNKPTDELINAYELNKQKYVFNLTNEFVQEAEKHDRANLMKSNRAVLTEIQNDVLMGLDSGMTKQEIAIKRGCSVRNVERCMQYIRKKGYDLSKYKNNGKSNNALSG